jgi:hypothetical protein
MGFKLLGKILAAFLICSSLHASTLGLENNNPGNVSADSPGQLRYWRGAIGTDAWHHIRFDTPEHGAEALLRNLRLYRTRHHLHTVREIIGRWVWRGVSKREREAYIAFVARRLRISENLKLDLSDRETSIQFARAIARYECGQEYFDEAWWKALPR